MIQTLVCYALQLFIVAIFARILLSWFPISGDSPIAGVYSFLFRVTEPVLGPVRRAVPSIRMGSMGLDLSPIIVLIGIQILSGFICR